MTVEKPKPKQLLRPITTGANCAMNQSQVLAITCNSLKAREKSRVHGAIGFGFAFHWLKNWCESFKPITKRSNRNHVITFDSHLKTALSQVIRICYLCASTLISSKPPNITFIVFLLFLAREHETRNHHRNKSRGFYRRCDWFLHLSSLLLLLLQLL